MPSKARAVGQARLAVAGSSRGLPLRGIRPSSPLSRPIAISPAWRNGERGHRRVEALDLVAPCRPASAKTLSPRRKDQPPPSLQRLSGCRDSSTDRRIVQRVFGLKRAIQRRDGDRLAAEDVEDGVEDHAFSPQ